MKSKRRQGCKIFLVSILVFNYSFSIAQHKIFFTVSMEHPETQRFQVQMTLESTAKTVDLKMPVWSPGYYQKMNYANSVENFHATDAVGNELQWQKPTDNTWQISGTGNLIITYEVKATRSFVASNFLDTTRGYIVPAGMFMHVGDVIQQPVQLTIKPFHKWQNIATGLDSVTGMQYTYTAPDFDILYDSPLLIGNLETLPPFVIKGITHYFVGYKLGDFDRVQFIKDLKKVVEAATNIIGDIPYRHYTFIATGPGQGGIEHLNSTTIGFNGSGLNTKEGRVRMLNFLSHEYFHHYNVKRIRPVELGPFDYNNGSRTKMLWLSEGVTVYYEWIMLRRAGITTQEELLNELGSAIRTFEQKPGRFFQTLEQASYETWSDGPFGRTGDEVNKTISYYEKGPLVGALLDLAIRHETKNKRSLDDLMRTLYKEYYQNKKRGFTQEEFRRECKKIAGKSLPEIFEYISTVKELNYPKYLSYAGLTIDTVSHEIDGAYFGALVQQRGDKLLISFVYANSPASQSGITTGDEIVEVNGSKMDSKAFNALLQTKKPNEKINLVIRRNEISSTKEILLAKSFEKNFRITSMPKIDALQKRIFADWSKGASVDIAGNN
ncbi:MAG TPA: PDZ domain-containing protein [Flavisolibacter sp.]|nr:PDZ domain-containing protein [Flavisolibacter sp.]